ncbi:Asparagine synthetase B [glutamine-hydrolyzing] [Phytophthora citrophthora]|uniref:Asparagine synthetase B [glutamine-hydrolyzing] n=1 Tax=Phytophthora citrophthora TaxID=4793 RepID=A0AAD9LCQ3_9STRA|nr:Asparagine synthetase B [glutamine-hydrolyzing] [Phytophthora citrophthora]
MSGLDVLIPLSQESYNQYLEVYSVEAVSPLTRFQLPVPESYGDKNSSHLLLLVGNSRKLWNPLLDFVEREMQHNEGRILDDPVDRYVQESIGSSLKELTTTHRAFEDAKVYWVADTEPGKMILAQKMALAAKAVSHCPPSQLCLHPTLGPWLAFRCAILLNIEGVDIDGPNREEGHAAPLIRGEERPELLPAECSHDQKLHDLLTAQMQKAFAQSAAAPKNGRIPPEAWRAWALPRLSLAPNHPEMYSSEQILYHYTKDIRILQRSVRARRDTLSLEYVRSSPSTKVRKCRHVLQEVLFEIHDRFPDGIDAILLSAGLDTSILSEASGQELNPVEGEFTTISLDKKTGARPILSFRHAFTVQADPTAQDAVYAAEIFKRLGDVSIEEHHVLRVTLDELLENSSEVARLLCTCDPMELRNSLVIYEALQKASECGVKHLVTGDAADEVFCGYSFYHGMTEEALIKYRERITTTMQFTTAKLAKDLGIEVLSPFLDARVVAFSKTLTKSEMVGERTPVPRDGEQGVHGKLILRQAFPESFSQWRAKEPIEAGSGTTRLRLGYFDSHWTDEEFEGQQRVVLREHGVFIRDREHLHFFQAFLRAFAGDLANVPRRRFNEFSQLVEFHGQEETEDSANVFCPGCGFELSHPKQDFCITCGCWPTCISPTNDSQGYATRALAKLKRNKEKLLQL